MHTLSLRTIWAITILFVICYCSLSAQAKYAGGSGTPEDPYQIWDANHMQTIGADTNDWDKHFKLMADVDLRGFTGTSFNIIGDWENPFSGVFDGGGNTIANFTYASDGAGFIGLFGYVDGTNSEIKNLGLIASNVDTVTGTYIGSLVGWLRDGTITNCESSGYVSGWLGIGGLVGVNEYGTITDCDSSGEVSGGWTFGLQVGGLVGLNEDGTITSCYSEAYVSGYLSVGGLVGSNGGTIINCDSSGDVWGGLSVGGLVGNGGRTTNCYATGNVTGNSFVGGLVGFGDWITNCYSIGIVSGEWAVGGLVGLGNWITDCYSVGSVSGNSDVGGLVGIGSPDYVFDSFWDVKTSGQTTSAGGKGKTTTEMQTMSTFTDAGWDFVGETVNEIEDIWFIPQQDYPHLWWEGMQVPMKLTPHTLNCRSKGNWVKAHLTLPEGFTVADVDSNRPTVLHSLGFQSTPLYVFVNKDKVVEIEAAFEREAICSLAGDWPQALTVAGFLTDGNIFLGTSTVRIIHPGMKVIEDLANCWLQGDCIHPTWCDVIDMNRDNMVNLLDYALLLNSKVEFFYE